MKKGRKTERWRWVCGLALFASLMLNLSAQPIPTQKLLPVDYGDLSSAIIQTEDDIKQALKEWVVEGHLKYISNDNSDMIGARLDEVALKKYGELIDIYRLTSMRSPTVNRHTGHGIQHPVEVDGRKWYETDITPLKNFASMVISEKTGLRILGDYPRFVDSVKEKNGYRISDRMRRFYNDLVKVYGEEFNPPLIKDGGIERIPAMSSRRGVGEVYFLMDDAHFEKFVQMNGWRVTNTVPSNRPRDWMFLNKDGTYSK